MPKSPSPAKTPAGPGTTTVMKSWVVGSESPTSPLNQRKSSVPPPRPLSQSIASPVTAEVVAKAFRGAEFLYTLKLGSGQEVLSLVPSHHDHAPGERIGIRLDVDHVVAFPD